MRTVTSYRYLLVAAVLLLGPALLVGCSGDSPTAPRRDAGQTPDTQGAAWSITITVSPRELELPADPDDPVPTSTVTATVRRSDGSLPADGSAIQFSASLGGFLCQDDSGQIATSSVCVVGLVGGGASLTYEPPATAGTAQIQVTYAGIVSSASVAIRLADVTERVFMLSHVEPSVGVPEGGETVTIHGTGFEAPVQIFFGSGQAVVQQVRSTQVRVTTPRYAAGLGANETASVSVDVTNAFGSEDQAQASLTDGFVYSRAGTALTPVILSVTPLWGPPEGGNAVTIRGTGFEAPVQVLFVGDSGATVEATALSVTSSQIVVEAPSARSYGLGGPVEVATITVRNLNSGLQSEPYPDSYRYRTAMEITSISPIEGPFTGGTLVTIFGDEFEAPVQVFWNGNPRTEEQVVSVSGSEIAYRTVGIEMNSCPSDGRVGGAVEVVSINSGDSQTGPDFTYIVPVPFIISVSPTSGEAAGGYNATITGRNFDSPVRVTFNEVPADVLSVTSGGTSITVRVPEFTGSFGSETCRDELDNEGTRPQEAAVSVEVTNLETTCSGDLSNGFIYEPEDTECLTDPPACNDGVDNDNDGEIDWNGHGGAPADTDCSSRDDDSESGVVVADFSFTLSGNNAQFTDRSVGSPTSWSWSFGDGAASSLQNPSHTYPAQATAVTYDVSLTASVGTDSDSVTKSVTIPASP